MSAATTWLAANQRYLMAEVARVRQDLNRAAGLEDGFPLPAKPSLADFADGAPPALAKLCAAFDLSPFERDILVLCAATELDGSIASLCARASGDPSRPYPTFGLALAALAEPHWSALAPVAPLRRWRLVELVNAGADPLVTARLRIDERVLHHLAGLDYLDERLAALIKPAVSAEEPSPGQADIVGQIAVRLREAREPVAIQLCGDDLAGKRNAAAAVSREMGVGLYMLSADDIPASAYERESLARLWEREAVLSAAVLLLETSGGEAACPRSRFRRRAGQPVNRRQPGAAEHPQAGDDSLRREPAALAEPAGPARHRPPQRRRHPHG